MLARDVMSDNVVTISADATLLDVARLLVNNGYSAVPVVDSNGMLVGVVSEVDLIRHAASGSDDPTHLRSQLNDPATAMEGRQVADVMTRQVVTATERTDLGEVAALILKHQTKRIPIVRGGAVVGIVSRIDLVRAMLSHAAPGSTAASAKPANKPMVEPDDEALRREVSTAARRLGFRLGSAFDVVVRHGVVHLWGQVSSQEEDLACRQVAAGFAGVTDVHSHMQVIARRR